jgi:hypothetical protein
MGNASVRFGLALSGMALWFAYPFVLWNGGGAIHQYQCSRELVVNGIDPCFTDYLPVLELMAFVLTLLLAYPFARFAFTLFAPPPCERGRGWRFAGSSAGSEYYPSLQLFAALGIGWASLHAKNYPPALYSYLAYWATWLSWFCLGIWMSWPSKEAEG